MFGRKKTAVEWCEKGIAFCELGKYGEGFRKSLEKVCINVFNNDYSDYENINTVKNPKETNIRTKSSVTRFTNDLYFLLKKYELIHTIPE